MKNVQIFLSFANFYRRFVRRYSKIAEPLSDLAKATAQGFAFPWNSDGPEEKTFQALKAEFVKKPILQHFDSDKDA